MAALPVAEPSRGRAEVAPMIRALLGAYNENVRDLARVLHLADTQVHKRLKGVIPWRAHELQAIADHFEVPVGTLFRDPLETLKTRSDKSERASHLRKVIDNPNPARSAQNRVPILVGQ